MKSIARIVSLVFHPVVPGFFVALFTAILHEGGLTPRLLKVAALVTTICVLFPLAATVGLFYAGRLGDDLYLIDRKSRRYLYPIIVLALVLTLYVFHAVYPFELAFTMTVAAIGVSGVLAAINTRMKASIHVAGLCAIAVAAAWVHGQWGLVVAAMVPLVAWARVTTKNHTLAEVIVGGAVGAGVTLLSCWTLLVR